MQKEKKKITEVVHDAVHRISDLACETSRMLNGYLIWLLERDQEVPDLRHSSGIMAQVFQVLNQKDIKSPFAHKTTSVATLNEYLDSVFSSIRNSNMSYCDRSGLSSIFNGISNEYSVNCLNHVQMNNVRYTRH